MSIKDLFDAEAAEEVTGGGGGGRSSVPAIKQQSKTPSGAGQLLNFTSAFVTMYALQEGLGVDVDVMPGQPVLRLELFEDSAGHRLKVNDKGKGDKVDLYLSFAGVLSYASERAGVEVDTCNGHFEVDFEVEEQEGRDYPRYIYLQYPDERVTVQ